MVKRLDGHDLSEAEDGIVVWYDDYAKLEAENASLKTAIAEAGLKIKYGIDPVTGTRCPYLE